MEVLVGDDTLGAADLALGDQVVNVILPAQHVHDVLELRFRGVFHAPGDPRPLAASFDWISFTPMR
jgi:hypothetical protein